MRVWFKCFLAALVLALPILSGCATSKNIPDGKPLSADQGLLAFQIFASRDYVLDFVPAIQSPTLKDKLANPALELIVKPGFNYYVVPMKEGEYRPSKVNDLQYGRGGAYVNLGTWRSFSVYAEKITYIGVLAIQTDNSIPRPRLHVHVEDDDISMRGYLNEYYPVDMKSMPYNHQLLHR